jgi:putative oxidoreductase
MSGLRAVAHPMLASIFIVQGLDTFRHPDRVTKAAEPVVRSLAKRLPAVPAETEQAVRLNGAVQVVAGTTLALGILPRLSAAALAGTLIPTTLAGHRYWEIEDPELRAQQRIHFLKNLTMLGGLLVAAADTGGSPSLAWRRRKAARAANRHLDELHQALAESARAAKDQWSNAEHRLPDSVRDAARSASEQVAAYARNAADQLPGGAHDVADSVRSATRTVAGQTADLARAAADYVDHASDALERRVARAS